MIKLSHLSKSYYGQKVVDNLSLEIAKGSIFGFLGPNGAGKTTVIKMIVGLARPDQGVIKIDDRDLVSPARRERIGFMPEDPYFYEYLSAPEFLLFMKSLFRQQASKTASKQEGNLLRLVGLADVGKKKIKDFSKGMKQRLGLAQALVNNPDYLFLDEPLDGLDPIGRVEFKRIFLNLKRKGKTIFFNSHILSDIEEICDSIGIINQGKLIFTGPINKFTGAKTLEQKFIEIIMEK